MTWFFDTFNYRLPVPIVEAEPARTFVTGSGDSPGPQGLPYLMEITITQHGGATTMRLVNSGFSHDASFDDEFEGVVSGWKMALATMKYWLEHHPANRRVHRLVMHPAPGQHAPLDRCFHTPEGRSEWLPSIVPDNAQVLVDTGREVLLEWREHRGVLGLKAFRMGPREMFALDFSAWPDTARTFDESVAAELQRALARLSACVTP
jgi:hypothetical protein